MKCFLRNRACKVIFKRLPKGIDAQTTDGLIEFDSRLRGKDLLIAAAHEGLHRLFPDLSEEAIEGADVDLVELLLLVLLHSETTPNAKG